MSVRHMRLVLGVFFLLAGLAVLGVRFGVPDVAARFNETRLLLGGLLALVLAGVNLAKWYSGWLWARQQSTPVRRPLQPDPAARSEEYNPEFDFGKDASKPAK